MDNRKNTPDVPEILQKHGCDNLETFLSEHPQQKSCLERDCDPVFYHPNKLAEKLNSFFAGAKTEANEETPLMHRPATPIRK